MWAVPLKSKTGPGLVDAFLVYAFLARLFRSVVRAVMPKVKQGAKTLGYVALSTGVNFLIDILSSKNVKQAAKSLF